MLLICPTCRSGLEVPDGTTALVRCPACKTVFPPADSAEPEDQGDEPRAKKRPPARDDAEAPRRNGRFRRDRDEEDGGEPENRDFDPVTEEEDRKRKRRRRYSAADADLSPDERAARRAAFQRAAWGCRLVWISFILFVLSMVVTLAFYFQLTFKVVAPGCFVIAGLLGLTGWLLAAIGVGLCLSGPPAPGHWGYGISAAVAIVVHGAFLLVVVANHAENWSGRDTEGATPTQLRWSRLATNLDATMFYMLAVAYSGEQGVAMKPQAPLTMVTGVLEMVRTMFIMMLLSCLARSALDEDLAHRCTRAAGVASIAPALVAFIILVVFATIIETNAGFNLFTVILILVTLMGAYAILAGVIFPSLLAARDVTDACDEPFQSLIPKL